MSITSYAEYDESTRQRAHDLFRTNQLHIYRRTDHLFAVLMVLQWVAGIIAALWVSPRTWAGVYSETHIHVWAAVLVGGAISFFPVLMAITRPGSVLTRQVIAVGQTLTSALLIHLSGGRIETHFHVFGSLAFLACYRDWRVLVTATVVVAADHFLRAIYFPQSVFGVISTSQWRVFEHAAWVVFEDLFLFVAINQSVCEMKAIAQHRAELEATNVRIEGEVERRTQELDVAVRELAKARDAADAANRAKSEFLANMSHEIRTPMTAILGFADILLGSVSQPGDIEAAKTIKRNGRCLVDLINDILDLSKIEAGKFDVDVVECCPRHIVADVASLMRVRALAKGLALEVRFDGPIPKTIRTDPARVRQVLVNIVGNAIKFTEHGTVELVVSLQQPATGDAKLRFDVIDCGIGISEEDMHRLFTPFTQVDGSAVRTFGGTGLGLAISKRLVQLLDGDITISSTIGEGSTFTIEVATGSLEGIELVQGAVEVAGSEAEVSTTGEVKVTLSNRRILLVEDGPDNQRLISFILKKAGAEVEIAENGQIGLDRVNQARAESRYFDVILMDMQMPVLDGYAATRSLRRGGVTLPIIALTAHAMEGDREKCLEAGCNGYLTKPIDVKNFVATVAAFASRAEALAASAEATSPTSQPEEASVAPPEESAPTWSI